MRERLLDYLLDQFDDIVFVDPTIRNGELNDRQLNDIKNWISLRYWKTYVLPHTNEDYFRRVFNRLKRLNDKYSDNIHAQLKNLIQQKCGVLNDISGDIYLSEVRNFNHIIENRILSHDIRCCKITGLDISMQKEDSIFLSESGVRYYYNYHPEVYIELEKWLSNQWRNSPYDDRFREIAHAIRHKDSDRRFTLSNQFRSILSNPTLFPISSFINSDLLKRHRILKAQSDP